MEGSEFSAVDKDIALIAIKQTKHKLHESGLTAAVFSDDCIGFTTGESKAEIVQCIGIALRIFKAHIAKFDTGI